MTGLPGRGGVGPKARVVSSVSIGVAIVLAAVWALVAAAGLLSAQSVAVMSESFWWAVVCGVVAACGLATPVALRLWRSGVEGLRGSEPDRDRASLGRGAAPAVAGRDEGRAQRELLKSVERHRGGITPVRAALETSLTVAEADRMLSDLAKGGHLEVRAEGGKLLYGL